MSSLSSDQSCAPISMRTSWLRSCRLPAHHVDIKRRQVQPIRLFVEATYAHWLLTRAAPLSACAPAGCAPAGCLRMFPYSFAAFAALSTWQAIHMSSYKHFHLCTACAA